MVVFNKLLAVRKNIWHEKARRRNHARRRVEVGNDG